jgi:hypothetical protein
VWAILKGYTTIEDFLNPKPKTQEDAFRMWQGKWKHAQIQELLLDMGYEIEKKIERKVYDWEVVGMADAIKDEGMEIKTSALLLPEAKKWHAHQAKLYATMFGMPFAIVQPCVRGSSIYLNVIGREEPDEGWFDKEMEKLNKFHLKLIEYAKPNL